MEWFGAAKVVGMNALTMGLAMAVV